MTLADRRGLDVEVYEPSEDSRLLAEAVTEDLESPGLVLDVGTGTGYVGGVVAEATGARVVGSDLNPHACRRARENGLDAVRADLVEPFAAGSFDAVVFNPPYLPVDPEAQWDDWFEVALSGGESGRAVIERFLDSVGRILRPGAPVYLLVSTLTGVDAVVEYAGERGFGAAALSDVSFPGETLTALKLLPGNDF